tara:strand:- start:2987 stop:3232 length:246 start_codon:yes stop_codon:yes gene_type:complete
MSFKMWKVDVRKNDTEIHILGNVKGTDYDIYLGDTFDSKGRYSWEKAERLFNHANLMVRWLEHGALYEHIVSDIKYAIDQL